MYRNVNYISLKTKQHRTNSGTAQNKERMQELVQSMQGQSQTPRLINSLLVGNSKFRFRVIDMEMSQKFQQKGQHCNRNNPATKHIAAIRPRWNDNYLENRNYERMSYSTFAKVDMFVAELNQPLRQVCRQMFHEKKYKQDNYLLQLSISQSDVKSQWD
ncbi:Hypothetical_protein [Hexamita inflata]|uniref:Hypothetical_protein n=1 Tax=Hexamita inflata TaxID=28002 RepID=A0AA86VNZ4_9EUKA|nr:Hypothetical protein HINF_LOCUS59538 [Hexamita inflata]